MNDTESVRIDKWLWAARFFKTRSLAKQAIEGGKIHYNGQRVKTSKMVELGAELKIRCGWDDKLVVVTAISNQRKNAAFATTLHSETEASQLHRAQQAAERKAAGIAANPFQLKPNKKQRRQIHRFKQNNDYDANE